MHKPPTDESSAFGPRMIGGGVAPPVMLAPEGREELGPLGGPRRSAACHVAFSNFYARSGQPPRWSLGSEAVETAPQHAPDLPDGYCQSVTGLS